MTKTTRRLEAFLAQCRERQRLVTILGVPVLLAGCAAAGVQSQYLDATEVGGAMPTSVAGINTQIYTKIVGTPFNLDILAAAVMNNNTISPSVTYLFTTYYAAGDSNVDLVDWDKSGGVCGSIGDANQVSGVTIGTPTTTAYGGINSSYYKWTGAEHGRKTYTSFLATKAVANARVRIYGQACNGGSCTSGTSCSHDGFTIRPASLSLSSTPAAGATQAAGSTYTMQAQALNASGSAITGYTGTPTITTTGMTDWKSQTLAASSFTGSFSAAATGTGIASGTFSYTDFGPLTIPAGAVADNTYVSSAGANDASNGDCVVGSSSNTASGGLYGCNITSASATTPTFIPHHYTLTHTITPACSNTFTYFGQSFNVQMVVDAINASGNRMKRLTAGAPNKPTFSWSQLNSGAATINPVTIPTANLVWAADTAYDTANGGEYFTSTTTSAPYSLGAVAFTTTRPSVTPPATASSPPDYESFKLRTTSSDANITTCNGVAAAGTTSCDSATIKLRYGVLKLSDGLGTSLTPATMQVTAQYWNGSSFVTNTDDSCTVINFNTGTIASSTTPRPTAKNASTTLSSGVGALMLTTSLASNMAIRLGGADNNCVSATASTVTTPNALSGYLGGVSCSTSYDKDPSARITFGTLRSSYIYRSEKF